MRTGYNFSPLDRSMIGVDLVAEFIDSTMRSEGERSYPPYDVEKSGDDGYRITLAAGKASEALKPRRIEILAPPASPNMRQINKDETERLAA